MVDPKQVLDSQLTSYDHFFDRDDFIQILNKLATPIWQFGHTSYPPNSKEYQVCSKFWKAELDDDIFFSEHLLNKIQEKTKQSFSLIHVYANGHTHGLDGTFHQDDYETDGRTFLLYANPEWRNEWGGGTQFYTDNGELRHILFSPNRAILFPGIVYHSAAPTTKLFNDLRVTVAWKLKLK